MNDRALKILEQYELEVAGTRRGRGSWYLDTPGGFRILSDYSGSENRAGFQNRVMGKLRESGYENVDLILPNKEGHLVSRDWEGNGYVVKEWYAGRECDTSNEGEILCAVRNLACLHRKMRLDGGSLRNIDGQLKDPNREHSCDSPVTDSPDESAQAPFSYDKTHFIARRPAEEFVSWNAQLRKIRSFIRSRPRRNVFEQSFLDSYEKYYAQAQKAEEELLALTDDLAALEKQSANAICHGDYSHHNVLICGREVATTNFDSCRFDFQVNDLYYFMRKILEKQEWNVRLGGRMLESYTQIRTLSGTERRLLRVKMLYPEKFRKLAGSYYVGSKAWISRQYMEKLEKTNRQERARQEFMKML
ncbi:MAG: phosphotransferase [Lachnospiraceae bacterium]|nr:phosphotransferase [Lachnospiraceae bacterium]